MYARQKWFCQAQIESPAMFARAPGPGRCTGCAPGTARALVPEALAYASIAGVSAVVGLYAAPGALILYAAFGSSRHLIVGPMAATAALSAAVGGVAAGKSGAFPALTETSPGSFGNRAGGMTGARQDPAHGAACHAVRGRGVPISA